MSHFDDLFWLVEVVDAGTLSAAAEKHNVTSAAVSKRLRLLEERLGVKLLVRTTRHLRTTEAGALYYQRGKTLLEEFNELEENIASTSERLCGSIRINAPLSFGMHALMKPIHAFMQLYPQLHITLHLDDRFIDILNSDYDLVIRVGNLEDSSLVAQRIAKLRLVCCAAPSYLAKHGTPHTPQELLKHNCLVYQHSMPMHIWEFQKEGIESRVPVHGNLVANNGDILNQAAILGQGLVYHPEFIAHNALANGDLVEVLKDYTNVYVSAYAMYPTRHFLPVKIRRLIEFLQQQLT
ncbi:LysR family transcriptional regulator [uncultured Thiothrix sp.]|uniref:LysR family transcriptional regulator n=1 Tax=uncultured Thiothrix sp. TaxID=223185 RepID=UPI00263426E3|nr:LysR family transcriptional regulator [uncultured Thiothrix sp.]HMT92879.1 LysR family transcriptional regulator [Thiolinea sp.]